MKNMVAFVGSARIKHTYHATKDLLKAVESYGEISYEVISLFDYDLKPCIGCKACLDYEEKLCPIKDDLSILIRKIEWADGVVFATPNYAFQVSGQMKIFLERMAYFLHRPKFFEKTCLNLVVEGVYGGKDILKYLNFTTSGFGFDVIKHNKVIKTLEPISEKRKKKNNQCIKSLSREYHTRLIKDSNKKPSIVEVIVFRVTRSKIEKNLNKKYKDYRYFKSNGWFNSDYYYPVQLGIVKRFLGNVTDYMITKL